MSVQGELSICLTPHVAGIRSEISSSRPMHAAQLFVGKTIKQTLQTLPLLFNICAKAQAVTAVRAIESAVKLPINNRVESQREALVCIESLREHSLQILMDWPSYINETINNKALSDVVPSLNMLMQAFKPQQLLDFGAKIIEPASAQQIALWQHCAQQLSNTIFGVPIKQWPQDKLSSLEHWAEQQQTPAARFIVWLNQQDWKHAGHSNIKLLPEIDDLALIRRLMEQQTQFTAQPDWQSSCYEASWFNYQQHHPIIRQLNHQKGNGIYTRMLARLIEVADLMKKLHHYFMTGMILNQTVSRVNGLASTNAARGRLSHYIELEHEVIKQFFILAPTEWNFHPQGVAAESLTHLQDSSALQLQADLLIRAIDPCVGYQLQISAEVVH
ncbi:MAG: hypothetical protein COB23_03345 [Methylophaga sp.]|nr:MAG: hypothetical protein COB23_03345 [Methylophaga sp.]